MFGVAEKRRVRVEKCSCWSIKKANMIKAKRLIKIMGTSYLNLVPLSPQQTIPDHASTFPYSSKNSSAKHIHAFLIQIPVCISVSVCVNVSDCVCAYVSEWVCLWWWVMLKHEYVWLRNFLEMYGKVEAVVRNSLLRWLGHLFEVTVTRLFDQSFCLKCISLFLGSSRSIFLLVIL